jgi:hypothetical protein
MKYKVPVNREIPGGFLALSEYLIKVEILKHAVPLFTVWFRKRISGTVSKSDLKLTAANRERLKNRVPDDSNTEGSCSKIEDLYVYGNCMGLKLG